MKYFIQTFGCQQNFADSERIAGFLEKKDYRRAKTIEEADYVVINTCMVREQAEDRIYGLVRNIRLKRKNKPPKIVISGCLPGAAMREPTGELQRKIQKRLPDCEFMLNEKAGFTCPSLREDKKHAFVPISNGCNNFCSYCIVPYARGREISRPFKEILNEVLKLVKEGYEEITLLGQNVNSYGADLIDLKSKKPVLLAGRQEARSYILPGGKAVRPVMVRSLGKMRIPTLFPYLLEAVCQILEIKKVNFLSSNPWDFSDELINIIAKNEKINRHIHLPVQSGDDTILKKMNRYYTSKEYLDLVKKIKKRIPQATFGTDIIVGFPGETKKAFENTVKLCKKVKFEVAYIGKYSPRPGTVSEKLPDNVSYQEKNRRFHILDNLVNKKVIIKE
jgi:tRNA-2-methylthio-N6-dimethylallyladenosine synthase